MPRLGGGHKFSPPPLRKLFLQPRNLQTLHRLPGTDHGLGRGGGRIPDNGSGCRSHRTRARRSVRAPQIHRARRFLTRGRPR